MATHRETSSNGQHEDRQVSIAERVASRGVRTARHLSNLALAATLDVVSGQRGATDSNAIFRGVNTTVNTIQLGMRIGEHKEVLDAPGATESAQLREAALLQREAELTAELEAIRERRGA